MSITPDSLVGAILKERPETLPVFLRNRMHCPGCVMATFMTIAEAAANYRLDPDELVDELRGALTEPAAAELPGDRPARLSSLGR